MRLRLKKGGGATGGQAQVERPARSTTLADNDSRSRLRFVHYSVIWESISFCLPKRLHAGRIPKTLPLFLNLALDQSAVDCRVYS